MIRAAEETGRIRGVGIEGYGNRSVNRTWYLGLDMVTGAAIEPCSVRELVFKVPGNRVEYAIRR